MPAQDIAASARFQQLYQKHWLTAPSQFTVLTQLLAQARARSPQRTSLLEVGPWHGDFSCEFLKQGWQLTVVEPWLGPEAHFNRRPDLDRSQLELDRRPVEQLLRDSPGRRWDVIFSPGLLYHVHDPFGIIDSYIKATDHIFLDTWHWVRGVRLGLKGYDRDHKDHWDHKPFRLIPGPWLVDHYFKSQGWCLGWQAMLPKVSGWPIWTAYYHRAAAEPLDRAPVAQDLMIDIESSRPRVSDILTQPLITD